MRTSLIVLTMASIVLTIATPAAGQTPAADKAAVMATVRQFVDGFNKGDTTTALAACAEQTSIIDEFPPHEWHGAGACAKWMSDYDADAKTNGITEGIVTLGTPRHLDVTADRAYVVVPSNYTFKKSGKPEQETGSTFTLTLQKGPAGWRITGWAWAKN
jgi:ketosteroid isomerase-like protein